MTIRMAPVISLVITTHNNCSNDSYGSKPSGGSYGSSNQDSYGSKPSGDSYGSSNQDSYGSKGPSKTSYGDSYGSSKTSPDDNNYGSSNNDSYGSSNTPSGNKPPTGSDNYGSSNAQPHHGQGDDFIMSTVKSAASKAGYNIVSFLPPNNP